MPKAVIHETFIGPFGERIVRYKDGTYEGILCPHYAPCPIDYRCEHKNPKYDWCKRCKVKTCEHSTKEKNMLIRKGEE
jgi:hypothetical protein